MGSGVGSHLQRRSRGGHRAGRWQQKKITISEGTQLKKLVEDGKPPEGGIWFCGEKYTITQWKPDEDVGEEKCFWALGAAPKKGVHIAASKSQIVVGFYSDEKGQSSGNCKKTVLAYVGYLLGEGY